MTIRRLISRIAPSLVVALTAVAAAAASGATPQVAAPDPIEGKWRGTAGEPQDRVESDLEFKRDDKGQIKAYLYRPVINLYGVELPGVVTKEGDTYVLKELKITATVRADRLEIHQAEPGRDRVLSRTEVLPAEMPVPELPAGPGPLWRKKLGNAIWAPVTARDGFAYVGTTGGVMDALSLKDGGFQWAFEAGRPIYGEALATDDALFFVCDNGFLFKLDRKTGKEVWRYDLGDAQVPRVTQALEIFGYDFHAPRPVLADGVVYVGSGDGGFHAVEAGSGKRVWRFEAKGRVRVTALVDGANVFFGTTDGLLYALDRASGREVWKKQLSLDITSSPALVGGRLIIGTRGAELSALVPASGEALWTRTFWGSFVESTAVPFGEYFYIGSSDLRRVACYDPKDGRVVWRTDVLGFSWGRPVVTDRFVYAGTATTTPYNIRHLGGFCVLDRPTGKIVRRWPAPDPAGLAPTGFAAGPALEGQTLVIGGLDGNVYAFPAE